jgi:hypothetical protein
MTRNDFILIVALAFGRGLEAQHIPELPRERAPVVGDVGSLYGHRCKIIQVVDDSSAVARIEWYSQAGRPANAAAIMYETVWLTGPTAGMVDDRMYETRQVYEVVGTKRYNTATGQRTVLQLEARNWKPASKKRK